MSYILSCLGLFNRLNLWHFLVIDCGFDRIIFRDYIYGTEYPGLGSTHPSIILWSEELSSLNSRYVYTEDAFDDGELGGVMFCKIISVIVCSFVPIYSQFLQYLFLYQPVPLHIPFFERFGFIPKFKNPSVVELYVLRGVAGFSWSNTIKAGRMPIYVYLLLKVPYVSASAAEDTKLRVF